MPREIDALVHRDGCSLSTPPRIVAAWRLSQRWLSTVGPGSALSKRALRREIALQAHTSTHEPPIMPHLSCWRFLTGTPMWPCTFSKRVDACVWMVAFLSQQCDLGAHTATVDKKKDSVLHYAASRGEPRFLRALLASMSATAKETARATVATTPTAPDGASVTSGPGLHVETEKSSGRWFVVFHQPHS